MKTFLILTALITSAFSQELPDDVKRLQSIKTREVLKIDEKYRNALNKALDKYTKQGDLTTANLIYDELMKGASIMELAKMIEKGDCDSISLKWESGGVLTLKKGGKARHTSWKSDRPWHVDGHGISISSGQTGMRMYLNTGVKWRGKVLANRAGTTKVTLIR